MRRLLLLLAVLAAPAAYADCTLLTDARTGRVLLEEGQCDLRTPPMSTFKIAISLMGYDAGVLQTEHTPRWPFQAGYVAWRPEWKQDTDPAAWMKLSVVWYSQQTTARLGLARFRQYIKDFDYGNQDASRADALEKSWLSTTLQISAREQSAFLMRLLARDLPVSAHAYAMTAAITLAEARPNGWELHGKTGSGDFAQGSVGWYVGWAHKDGRSIVFVRQVIETADIPGPAGLRARDLFLKRLPELLP
ncbi:penicillin-binding transpeptidase domain-containing protein [Massilia sp. TS11]|uniref:penicillin-binding transpeptidase domain-containing protein n=1 Tax=Massilia sp. TS11 TaxID=2908003 RepID=UPI001EDA21F3|nr:penicillin-binding transpeptidase domain-containing protein [Massilia sp. TS11]MCG2584366.1 class D beta-lactamase [Massilia sp. TS11]